MSHPNLSSWTVTFHKNDGVLGWQWRAEHADGTTLASDLAYMDKDNAEADAVKAMERHESGVDREEINGFRLAKRVRDRSEEDASA